MCPALQQGWTAWHFDYENHFSNGPLDRSVIVEVLTRVYTDTMRATSPTKVNRSVDGLKDAAQTLDRLLFKQFIALALQEVKRTQCIFVKHGMIVIWYVDDIVFSAENEKNIDKLKAKLEKKFRVKDLGKLKMFLGSDLDWSKDEEVGSQQATLIQGFVDNKDIIDAKAVGSPINPTLD